MLLIVQDCLSNMEDAIRPYVKMLVNDILPLASMYKNDTNIGVRILSAKCFEAILNKQMIEADLLIETWQIWFPALTSCINEDCAPELRQISLASLTHLINVHYGDLDDYYSSELYPEILRRLDDSQDAIRIQASSSISRFFKRISQRKGNFGNYKYVLGILFIQIDDPSEEIQKAMRETLVVAMKHNKDQFL